MPVKPRPPMPKLPPFALMNVAPRRKERPQYLALFLGFFGIPLFLIHLHLISLPYFWDELGQFVPSALDLARFGFLIPHSAVPNVHPPGLAAYLALCYKLFGFSIPVTRAAMLTVAAFGLLLTFLLAIELSQGAKGAPAFFPPVFLLISPLFYTQSMLAQLDMPAMVFTLLSLLLFVRARYFWAMAACVVLVLVKETGIVAPFVFFCVLGFRKDWRRAVWFSVPALVLAGWLLFLHSKTGFWLGDPEFVRYNVGYAAHPVRMLIALSRRIYYLFLAEFRWLGTAILIATVTTCKAFHKQAWATVAAVGGLTTLLVSVFGGAELERYVLPVLPLFYIAVSVALTMLKRPLALGAAALMIAALIFCILWNPPYPFPFENNYAMVDFVHLEQSAAAFAEANLRGRTIATAWPYTAALRNSDWGFVQHRIPTLETGDLHYSSVKALPPESFDTLITYTREWTPVNGLTNNQKVQRFLQHFYQWEPDITPEQCQELGLQEKFSLSVSGQTVAVFVRKPPHGE